MPPGGHLHQKPCKKVKWHKRESITTHTSLSRWTIKFFRPI